jgi:hypothetical protein
MEKDFRLYREDDIIRVVVTGVFSLDLARAVVGSAIRACEEHRLVRALADIRSMQGDMATLDRYEAGTYGAKMIPRTIAVAMLARPDQISPDSFFENVLVNRGVNLRVFSDQEEALEWLKQQGHPSST